MWAEASGNGHFGVSVPLCKVRHNVRNNVSCPHKLHRQHHVYPDCKRRSGGSAKRLRRRKHQPTDPSTLVGQGSRLCRIRLHRYRELEYRPRSCTRFCTRCRDSGTMLGSSGRFHLCAEKSFGMSVTLDSGGISECRVEGILADGVSANSTTSAKNKLTLRYGFSPEGARTAIVAQCYRVQLRTAR
jgi:hypothetical protein